MTRRAAKPQRPRHVPILDEDWEWLEKAYGAGADSSNRIGAGPAIRGIVNIFVKAQKAKEQAILDGRLFAKSEEDVRAEIIKETIS